MTEAAPRTRTGTLTPTSRDPVRVTVAIDPEDNLPTRASLDVFVRALLLPDNDWYLDTPWDADREDGSTRLVLRRARNDSAFAILVLDAEPASEPAAEDGAARLLDATIAALGRQHAVAVIEYNDASDRLDRNPDAPALFDTLQTRRTQLHALTAVLSDLPPEIADRVRAHSNAVVGKIARERNK